MSGTSTAAASSTVAPPVTNPGEALERLLAGNKRFVDGKLEHPGRDDVRRAELSEDQAPYAVILGCSDSRVPPEIIFDESIGDLFPVRVAGNTAATGVVQGSIEYSIAVLGSVLVVVLGHEKCGAVKAALESVNKGTNTPGQIPDVISPIIPAAEAVKGQPADEQLPNAIHDNVRRTVSELKTLEPLLAAAVRDGKVQIVGAEYHLKTGAVELVN